MPRVFISYRRADTADASGRIYDYLCRRYGVRNVFKDVDSIPVGIDYRARILSTLHTCTSVLAVIGDRWLEASDAARGRRIDDPEDVVRLELETALRGRTKVVPVLVGDATMPAPKDLPDSLRPLCLLNAARVRSGRDFAADMAGLCRALPSPGRVRGKLSMLSVGAGLALVVGLVAIWYLPGLIRSCELSLVAPDGTRALVQEQLEVRDEGQGQKVDLAVSPAAVRLFDSGWAVKTPVIVSNRGAQPAYAVAVRFLIHGPGVTATSPDMEADAQQPPFEFAVSGREGTMVVSGDQLRLSCEDPAGNQLVYFILHTVPAGGSRTIVVSGTTAVDSTADVSIADFDMVPRELIAGRNGNVAILFTVSESVKIRGTSVKMWRRQ